jgi:hypothetical protein
MRAVKKSHETNTGDHKESNWRHYTSTGNLPLHWICYDRARKNQPGLDFVTHLSLIFIYYSYMYMTKN